MYDFDTAPQRSGTNSIKYDFARERGMPEGLLPMWVADMDIPAPPEVLSDIRKVVEHGIFGYTEVKADYYDAVADWFGARYGYRVPRREIVKAPGVVFVLAQAVRAFTEPGDAVLIQTPVYYPFYNIIRENDRRLVTNPMIYADGRYAIDFDDFERKIAENNVRLFILCNPHNPVGRVFTRGELERLGGICDRFGVIPLSDEIHCDFVWDGFEHTCFGHISDNAVIATSPSKTFNLAGLQVSNIFIRDAGLRKRFAAELSRSGYSQLNTVGLAACQSAYTKGGGWLSALKGYLSENIRIVGDFLLSRLPNVRLVPTEGTYLVWLDFSAYGLGQDALDARMTAGAGLWLDSGTMFGADGAGFQRMNIACPRATLLAALENLGREFG